MKYNVKYKQQINVKFILLIYYDENIINKSSTNVVMEVIKKMIYKLFFYRFRWKPKSEYLIHQC